MSPQNRARLRRARRIALRVALVVGVLLVVAVGSALAALHTPWGREQIRGQLESAFDDAFAGEVRIGAVTGSVLGDLQIHDVVIEDLEGRPAIRIAKLTVDVGLLPLIRKEVRFYETTVAGLVVDGRPLRDGRLNLAALLKEKEEPEESGWDLVLDDLDVPAARIAIYQQGQEPIHLAPFDIVDGKLASYTSGTSEVDLAATALWWERGLMVSVGASLDTGPEQTRLHHLDAAIGALELAAKDVVIAGRDVRGEATIDAPAAAVAMLVPSSPLRGDVALHVVAAPGATGGTTAIRLDGKVADATLDGDLTLAPSERSIKGRIHAARVDAAAIVRDAVDTMVDATITVDGAMLEGREGIAALQGTLTLDASGEVDGMRAKSASLAVDLENAHADVRARVRGDGGLDARVDAAVGLPAAAGAPVVIDEARIVAKADDLRKSTPVRGAVALDLTVSGRVGGGGEPVLAVRGDIDGRRLSFQRKTIGHLDVDVDLRGLPRAADGHVHVDADSIYSDGRFLGNLKIDAETRKDHAIAVAVHSEPPRKPWLVDVDAIVKIGEVVRIDLGEHRIQTSGVAWSGHGGAVEIDDHAIRVARLRTTIAKGRLAIDGTVEYGGRHAGDLATSVHLDGIDLAEVERSLDLGARWQGRLDTRVHVIRRGARWYGSVEGDGRGVKLQPEARPIDFGGVVKLQPGLVIVDARVHGDGVGTVDVDVEVAAPKRLEDARAWQRLDRKAIEKGRIVLDALDLAAVAKVAGSDAQVEGRIDGEIVLTATQSTGAITAQGVRTPQGPATVDAKLQIHQIEATAVAVQLTAAVRDLATAEAQALFAIPARPFDPQAWARMDMSDLRGATVKIDDLKLDAARSRQLGLAEPWFAEGKLLVTIAPALADARLSLDVAGVRGGPIRQPLGAHVEADVDGETLRATLRGTAGTRQILAGELAIPVGLDVVRHRRFDRLGATPIEGRLTIDRARVRDLTTIVGRTDRIVGTLDGKVHVTGTVSAPEGTASFALRQVGLEKPTLRSLIVDGSYADGVITAKARGAQHDGGALALDARAELAALDRASATLTAEKFDLAPLAQLGPKEVLGVQGLLDARVAIVGLDPAKATIDGFVDLTRARMPLGPQLGTMREGTIRVELVENVLAARVKGQVGNGTLAVRADGRMRGLMPEKVDASVSADDVTLISDAGTRIDGELTASARRTGDRWRIDGEVKYGTVIVPESDGRELHEPGIPEDMVIIENGRPTPRSIEPEASWGSLLGQRPSDPFLIAEIRIRRIRVQSKELRGVVRGRLEVAAGDDGVALDGEIRTQQGSVALFDRRYRIDRGRVVFDGSADPLLDVAMQRDFPQMTLFINVRGRASAPDLELSSNPATYSEGQLLSILIGGSPGMEPGSEARDAASGVASALLSQKVGGYVDDYLPVQVDVLRFEAETASSSASFTVGKWFTRKLFVAYQRRLEARPEQNAGEAQLEYWLAPDIMVEGKAGDRGHHDVDLLWIKRW